MVSLRSWNVGGLNIPQLDFGEEGNKEISTFYKSLGYTPIGGIRGIAGQAGLAKKSIVESAGLWKQTPSGWQFTGNSYKASSTIKQPVQAQEASLFQKMFGGLKAETPVGGVSVTPKPTASNFEGIKDIPKKAGTLGGAGLAGFTGAAVGAGALGFLGGILFGGGDKKTTQTAAPQNIDNRQYNYQNTSNWTYSPQTTTNVQETYAPSNITISNSPNASVSKKDTAAGTLTSNPAQTTTTSAQATQTPSQSAQQGQTQQAGGSDWLNIVAVAGIALVAYGMVNGKKSKSTTSTTKRRK